MSTQYIINNNDSLLSGQTISGDLIVTNSLSATTFYGDGSGLTGVTITPSYKVYTALLTQTGATAPVDTVLENTLGATITWTYNAVGEYYGELSSGTFDPVLTFTTSNSSFYSSPYFSFLSILSGDNTKVILGTFDTGSTIELDGEICIEIRVYN